MCDTDQTGWADVEQAAAKMFNVWTNGSELQWARQAWGHLSAAGLTGRDTVLESTASLLRLVTLARIYREFCGFAWEENPETPLAVLAEKLEVDPVALGILAAPTNPDQLEDAVDYCELREAALAAVTDSQRPEIFQCLKAAFGGENQLYSRLWHTRPEQQDTEGEEFEVTGSNSVALEYVMNGFQS
jgi:hypothetical protein